MEILEIIKAFDGYLALGIAVWIINLGWKERQQTLQQQADNYKQALADEREQNAKMFELLMKLCNGGE